MVCDDDQISTRGIEASAWSKVGLVSIANPVSRRIWNTRILSSRWCKWNVQGSSFFAFFGRVFGDVTTAVVWFARLVGPRTSSTGPWSGSTRRRAMRFLVCSSFASAEKHHVLLAAVPACLATAEYVVHINEPQIHGQGPTSGAHGPRHQGVVRWCADRQRLQGDQGACRHAQLDYLRL